MPKPLPHLVSFTSLLAGIFVYSATLDQNLYFSLIGFGFIIFSSFNYSLLIYKVTYTEIFPFLYSLIAAIMVGGITGNIFKIILQMI